MSRKISVTLLRDITPKGWTSVFYAQTSRLDYDPTSEHSHQLVYQRGPQYGSVGDMAVSVSHVQLLEWEQEGLIRISR